VHKALQVFKELPEYKVHKVLLVFKALKELLGYKVHKALLVFKAL
jgi:hypothetical protein